ncbi:MAG: alpha/beta hydrolase [Bdellovibrionales bacterium]|nr:alpha/beta hydrolase [Bdellovibrionales bacterium]
MRLILFRGLVREQRHWGPFLPAVERAFPEAKVHCLDFPGIGTEYGRQSPYWIEDISDDLEERWQNLGISAEEPIGLIGLSLGGMIALHWCARNKMKLNFAVAINSSAGNQSFPWHRLKLDFLSKVWRAQLSQDPRWKEKIILGLVSNSPEARSQMLEEWTQLRITNPVSMELMFRQLVAASFFRAPAAAAIRLPLLFLNSLKDQMVSPECSVELARRYQAPLKSHPWAGHELTTDDPEWVIRQIQKFSIERGILSASSLVIPEMKPSLKPSPAS